MPMTEAQKRAHARKRYLSKKYPNRYIAVQRVLSTAGNAYWVVYMDGLTDYSYRE